MYSNLFSKLVSGDKVALAKAITLIESNNAEHTRQAEYLITQALQLNKSSLRIAVTGIPGVGKSTFINQLGTWLVNELGKKVCVLAIDPSSIKNKGSILGDKTRMNELASLKNAFIRPSPTRGFMGGISQKTLDTVLICEAAGYEIILIETVGTGQNETYADNVSDCMLLLHLANTGDELQGIKRGIMEMADIIVLNKTDLIDTFLLKSSINDLKNALNFHTQKNSKWVPPILSNSVSDKNSITEIWKNIEQFVSTQKNTGKFENKRFNQKKIWFTDKLKNYLNNEFFNDLNVKKEIEENFAKQTIREFDTDKFLRKLLKNWLNRKTNI
ncbi:MAG: methylmalonyl Co-A mutase-associated GTPase MeaB [Bacteroidia bacterium]|nr:methylmalonyl Co-A mutase-associated GTPase MeaB [Bacteroidia bacterium]